ncbi:MAG: hypothetical protein Q9227_004366 [Pyrenula ochraceoflavens]
MASKTYNVGIIGYGMSAKVFHLPLLKVVPDFRLHAIVQRTPKPDDDAGKDYPDIKRYGSSDELFADSDVDVVIVTTAPDSHYSLTEQALQAGKHVVVEKPFTPTSREAYKLVALAKEKGKILTVYQNRRWDSDFLTLSKLLKNGSLGRVVEFETHFDRHRPEIPQTESWKYKVIPGGGVIYDLGTHLMDQVVTLFGLPSRVTGFIGSQRERNPEGFHDSCMIILHFEGMKAIIKAAVVSPEVRQLRYWVRGDKGSFKKYHLDCQEDQLKEGLKPGDPSYGTEPKERYGTLSSILDGRAVSEVVPTVEPATYAEFYRKLARALGGDEAQIPVDPSSAALVIYLVEKAQASSDEGKTLDV